MSRRSTRGRRFSHYRRVIIAFKQISFRTFIASRINTRSDNHVSVGRMRSVCRPSFATMLHCEILSVALNSPLEDDGVVVVVSHVGESAGPRG